jgi:hypothetical protein
MPPACSSGSLNQNGLLLAADADQHGICKVVREDMGCLAFRVVLQTAIACFCSGLTFSECPGSEKRLLQQALYISWYFFPDDCPGWHHLYGVLIAGTARRTLK